MPILLRSITLAALALASGMVAAHDGESNAEGCHHDGKGYHCHRRDASRPSPVQTFVPGGFDSLLDDASGTGPLSATGETEEEERAMKEVPEAGISGLLVLAVLFVLALYTLRGVPGRRSQHRK